MKKLQLTQNRYFERLFVTALFKLPAQAQILLCGGKPVKVGRRQLHPQLQLFLHLRKLKKAPGFSDLSPQETRKILNKESQIYAYKNTHKNLNTRDIEVALKDKNPENHRTVKVRQYFTGKEPALNQDALIFIHGGGFVLGDLDTHDDVCRFICEKAQMQVLSIEYRLAPEFIFPAGLEDCWQVYKWLRANAAQIGFNPKRIFVAGDSAGGNLAAGIVQRAQKNKNTALAGQLLIYPATDGTFQYPSRKKFSHGYLLTAKDIEKFSEWYAPGVDVAHPLLSPIHAPNLHQFPPSVVVTAGFDPLCDEGKAYSKTLRKAGVAVKLLHYDSFIHGFINLIGMSSAAREALNEIVEGLNWLRAQSPA